jgi:hypothetical protein
MRLGSIVDALAVPGFENAIVAAAIDRLRDERVDLVVSNQSHAALTGAMRRHGFLNGPSNFLFAASPALAGRIGPAAANLGRYHLNRGDGDGPINL